MNKNARQSALRLWRVLRQRALLCMVLSIGLGCGDCVSVSDFVDITDASVDADSADMSRPDTPPVDDMGRGDTDTEKDFELFDFGFEDTDVSQPFDLAAIVPSSGPVGGGTQVRIEGTGLQDGSLVYFGSQAVESTLSQGRLIVRTPAGSGPGPVAVKVLAPDGDSRVIVDGFRYVVGLVISEVSPSRIPVSGGVEVEILGDGFEPESAVSFSGDAALRVTYLSPTKLRALAPPRARGFADVRVTTRFATAVLPRSVEYYTPLTITSVIASSGPVSGGQTVVLRGTGFDARLRAFFGATEATVSNVNVAQQAAQVIVPPHFAGLVDVAVVTESDAAALSDGYFYAPDGAPMLGAISPRSGPKSGGNSVTVIGQGLDSPGAAFEFGGNAAGIDQISATAATLIIPPGMGVVDVTFAINGTVINTLTGAYSYVNDLTIGAITPTSGSVDGGETVTITGTGLVGAAVSFGQVSAEILSATETQMTIRTPAHSAGKIDVVVSRDGLDATDAAAYEYIDRLEVWGFTPTRGSVAGETFVQLRGRGFEGELSVALDNLDAVDVRRVDRNNLSFRTPSHPEGDVSVSVSASGQTEVAPYTFQYFNPASRFGGASGGPVDGAVNVTVHSLNGGPLENAFVMLSTRGDTPYQGFTDVNGMITLSGADVIGPQTTTATRAGYSTATIQTVDAENITLFLTLLDPPPNPGGGTFPPSAAIYGNIHATGKLSDPDDEDTYDLAIVGTTTQTIFGNNPTAGPNAIVLGEGRYEINTRIGDMAVVGLCGEFNSVTQVFTPKLMAVERFIYVNDLDRLNYDLVCNIPLDQTMTFKLTNPDYAPTGPNNNRIELFWDFGFEGVFRSPVQGTSLSNVVEVGHQPKPADDIADLRFVAYGGSYTNQGAPFSRARTGSFTFTTDMINVPPLLDVPLLITPVAGGTVQNNVIRFESGGPYYPDMFYLVLRNDSGIPVWQWIIPGTQPYAVIPDFPDFTSVPQEFRPSPLLPGLLYLSIFATRTTPGFVFESVSYREINSEAWSAYALYSAGIMLP